VTVANKLILGLLLVAVSVAGVAYFILGSRQEKLQAKVYVKSDSGKFPNLTCPNQVAVRGEDEADYTLKVNWFPISHNTRKRAGCMT
jgi:hypothetical protein